MQQGESAITKLERRLNEFVEFVAFWERLGNTLSPLVLLLAAAVLNAWSRWSLKPEDFWLPMVMIFIDVCRNFSRYVFQTTRALEGITSSFSRVLCRPQEGDEVVLIMGLWIKTIDNLHFMDMFRVPLLILMSWWPRQPGRLQICALLIAYPSVAAYKLSSQHIFMTKQSEMSSFHATALACITEVVAVLLLCLRPRRIANLTRTLRGRKLLSLAKVISAVWLASRVLVFVMLPSLSMLADIAHFSGTSFAAVVLSLGSLQTPETSHKGFLPFCRENTPGTCGCFGRCIDFILRMCFLCGLVLPFPDYFFQFLGPHPSPLATARLSVMILLVFLLIGNLHIQAAIVQVVLSSGRLYVLLAHHDYTPLPEGSIKDLVEKIAFFYVLMLCQGIIYIVASILGVFSFFPRRSLVRQSKFSGQWGAKTIDLYYQHAYATWMKGGTTSLANFAIKSLNSCSPTCVFLLDCLLQESDSSGELMPAICWNSKAVSMLMHMFHRSDVREDTRLFAARVIAKIAGRIETDLVPSMLWLVSSLLNAEIQPPIAYATIANDTLVHKESNKGCSWVCRRWQQMKDKWSIPEEPPLTPEDSLPVLGITIFEKLAFRHIVCADILEATDQISKVIELSYTSNNDGSKNEAQNAVMSSSLNLLRRLATTHGKAGVALRQKLWKNHLLLLSLTRILDDSHSSPRLWEPVMHIIAKFTMNEEAGRQIGRDQVVIRMLLHAFLGRDAQSNRHYDQSLRTVAGEALANIATWGAANCSTALAQPEVIEDLSKMLCQDEYRYVAGNLLQSICAQYGDKLRHLGASVYLCSAVPVVVENIMSAKGKQLESLIGLASQICDVIPESFFCELESHGNGDALVQNLVRILKANMIPYPEYPRMRRVVVETVISIAKSCPGYAAIFRSAGMRDALNEVGRPFSRVEKYRVYCEYTGVVLETGPCLSVLVARAKRLISSAAATPDAPFDYC